jgi:hypothetical protein
MRPDGMPVVRLREWPPVGILDAVVEEHAGVVA